MADVRNFVSQENLQAYNEKIKENYGNVVIVDAKPVAGVNAKEKTLYLVKQTAGNGYDAFIYNGTDVFQITDAATADFNHKVDKVDEATEGNIATLTSDGGIQDSKTKIGDLATKQSVNDLTTTVNTKADKGTTLAEYTIGDAYTKTETNEQIADAIGKIEKITKEIVEQDTINGYISAPGTAKENVIYMVHVESGQGDQYKEYMKIDAENFVQIGDTSVDLSGYVQSSALNDYATKAEIQALNTEDSAEEGKYVSTVSQANGKITVTKAEFPDYDSKYEPKDAVKEGLATIVESETNGNFKVGDREVPICGLGTAAYVDVETFLKPADIAEVSTEFINGLFA